LSKKKFTDGLESLFTTDHNKESGEGTAFLEGAVAAEEQERGRFGARKPSSKKNFTTDLDSLLEAAMQESFEEQIQNKESGGTKAQVFHQQTHRRRPMGGLDMLIRRTVERSTIEEDKTTGTKRLTVAFDKVKLGKLKRIARIEKAYLKDILGEIVEEYIRRYEQGKKLDE
jgi:hypothetical protein